MRKMLWLITGAALLFGGMAHAYCQPQCVPYARERSGIYTCRVGVYGTAYDWYRCEERSGRTSSKPKKGRVGILKPNQNGIGSTGHAFYVAKSEEDGKNKYSIRVDHSNFNNRCSIETGVKATYYLDRSEVKFKSGAWNGRTFKTAGFIKQ